MFGRSCCHLGQNAAKPRQSIVVCGERRRFRNLEYLLPWSKYDFKKILTTEYTECTEDSRLGGDVLVRDAGESLFRGFVVAKQSQRGPILLGGSCQIPLLFQEHPEQVMSFESGSGLDRSVREITLK
jgi:hypothetical protein